MPTEPAVLPGDADGNGSVDMQDALLVLRFAMSLIGGESIDAANADMNGDGTVDMQDALLILRKAMGLIDR